MLVGRGLGHETQELGLLLLPMLLLPGDQGPKEETPWPGLPLRLLLVERELEVEPLRPGLLLV